ncbi:hypothetical protein Aspvir_009232 [Aspergillus viridinutans]|uniref:Uncharacterized protein n=1 Tax=Aspergillus viridinutans TaxID=75553 RepID=A0A9P3BZH8_ASPVI|nr:uncharacterized protein Aspvir_009232 [Aspergillus viridinutans]GIK05130.1 hypothetical protein Aspvir_009232 [Aspergillus viridinutans]
MKGLIAQLILELVADVLYCGLVSDPRSKSVVSLALIASVPRSIYEEMALQCWRGIPAVARLLNRTQQRRRRRTLSGSWFNIGASDSSSYALDQTTLKEGCASLQATTLPPRPARITADYA